MLEKYGRKCWRNMGEWKICGEIWNVGIKCQIRSENKTGMAFLPHCAQLCRANLAWAHGAHQPVGDWNQELHNWTNERQKVWKSFLKKSSTLFAHCFYLSNYAFLDFNLIAHFQKVNRTKGLKWKICLLACGRKCHLFVGDIALHPLEATLAYFWPLLTMTLVSHFLSSALVTSGLIILVFFA